MSQFRILVADDEPLARGIVTGLLKQDPEVALVHECGDAAGAREGLARLRPDIAFLDVEMPGASGLQVAEGLEEEGPVVVFITAFSAYAAQAFEVSATDYVLKPFSDERFKEALDRAKRQVRQRRLGALASQVASLSNELQQVSSEPNALASPEYLQRLALKDGDRTTVLKVGDVIWIEAEDYYVLVHSKQGRHLVRATLASFEQRLDPRVFLRVHRTAIVNVEEVRSILDANRLVLTLSNGTDVAVSRSRRSQVEPLIRPRLR
ncbi:MAG TPA: LytTR family DNA-binding domain-containing protein [Vicinamibacterales bacterium]